MTQDRGDQLAPGDALAVALSERAASARGVRLDDAIAREYLAKPLLSLDEAVAIVQGLVPLLPNTLHGPQHLGEFECEVERLQRDVLAGALAMPCRPVELAAWARALHLEFHSAFQAALLPPASPASPPPAKARPDQQDRIDCQHLAIAVWSSKTLTIEKMLGEPDIARYVRKYTDDTVRKWLSEVDPRPPEHRRGPRKRAR